MFKKLISLALSAALSFTVFTSASAMPVMVNGDDIEMDSRIMNDTAFVPVRNILEVLGAEIEWHAETQTVIAWISTTKATLKNNTDYITVNGVRNDLGAAVQVIDGTTYVPLRAVAEALGSTVSYDEERRMIVIEKGELPWTIGDVFNGIMSMKGWYGDIAFSIGETVNIDGVDCAKITAYDDNGAVGEFAVSYNFADVFDLSDGAQDRLYLCR